MNQIFPLSNIVTGVLILIVGFGFHWIAQLVSVINWDFATRVGIQEKGMPKEFRVYEHAIAMSDVLIGWVYAIAGVGLVAGLPWTYKLLWFPGIILVYHSIGAWFWFGNQVAIGHRLSTMTFRIIWCSANFVTGTLTIFFAWQAG